MSSQTIVTHWFSNEWLLEQKFLIALLVLIAVVSSMSPSFFTLNNLFNILQQTSVNVIMAVGMTLVTHFRHRFVGWIVAGADRYGDGLDQMQ